jgi:stage II sporulation protein D
MKKRILSILLAAVIFTTTFIFGESHNISAQSHLTSPLFLRVGLERNYRDRSSITINTNNLMMYTQSGNNNFIEVGFVISSNQYTVVPDDRSYFILTEGLASLETAQRTRQQYVDMGYNVQILRRNGMWFVCSDAEVFNYADITPNERRLRLSDGMDVTIIFDSELKFAPIFDEYISIDGRQFRGMIEFLRFTGFNVSAVNIVELEHYLYSVVPAEMPSTWHIEALRAQAMASRNYAVTSLTRHSDRGYHLCDSVHCQVYSGVSSERETTTRAVNDTAGRFIYFENEPISAFYFSSSGGHTENSENVWSGTVPYARGVPEINEVERREWVRSFTLNELTQVMRNNHIDIGNVTRVGITRVSNAGRAIELTFYGTRSNHTVSKDEIRWFFNNTPGGALDSTNFRIVDAAVSSQSVQSVRVTNGTNSFNTPISDIRVLNRHGEIVNVLGSIAVVSSSGVSILSAHSAVMESTGEVVTFSGTGWGHGVGMSQFGAKGMAEIGYSYIQILQHYYRGVTIR